jgi:cystathionine gamma-synthase
MALLRKGHFGEDGSMPESAYDSAADYAAPRSGPRAAGSGAHAAGSGAHAAGSAARAAGSGAHAAGSDAHAPGTRPQPPRPRLDTIAIIAGRPARTPDAPLSEPITLASAFHAGGPTEYARDGHPTAAAFEDAMGALEGGHAVAFASGMAACAAILDALPAGATVVAPHGVYMGVRQLLEQSADRLTTRWVDETDTASTLAAARGADLLWIETPLNPLLEVADLPALANGAEELGVPLAVDATVASPVLLRPLEHGATWSVQSATKHISGHGDLLMGVVTAADEREAQRLVHHRQIHGATPGALESFLALRGLRTLPLRMECAQTSARELVERLRAHPDVERVRYPGGGSVLSLEVAGGAQRADALCRASELFPAATSFGGVQSTMERRARWPQERGVPEALVRVSVGCEDVEDLWEDLERALQVSGDRPRAALGASPR